MFWLMRQKLSSVWLCPYPLELQDGVLNSVFPLFSPGSEIEIIPKRLCPSNISLYCDKISGSFFNYLSSFNNRSLHI